jgi:hypothetical protein
MENYFDKAKSFFLTPSFTRTFKIIGFFFLGLIAIILVAAVGLRIYFEKNKTEIVEQINAQISENIKGEAKIGDIGYKFLVGFPHFTVVLNKVELKDSLIAIHKRPVLKAAEVEVRLNVLSFLNNEVNIHKIVINDATIDLFKDKNGISNFDIFRTKKKKPKTGNNTSTSFDEVILRNVNFISENQKGNKLFFFQIKTLKSKIKFSGDDWKTDVYLKTFAKSLAFNTRKGSFVKDKEIEGKLSVDFSKEQNRISVLTDNLNIGGDIFDILARFNVGNENALFDIHIKTNILWQRASNLLSNNISSRLNRFELKKPLSASCVIKGDMSAEGDPEIVVHAVIENDELGTSYGEVKNCSFKGKFTNNYRPGLGINNINSAIIITDFKGNFNEIPISIPFGVINNVDNPVATGKFTSKFNVEKLKNMINEDFMKFSGGTAQLDLLFKVDIIDLRLNKPHFTGNISINNSSFYYRPKNIKFQKTDIELHFTEQALLIQKIKFQNKTSTVYMQGKVANFLNLYYDAPEKMIANWKIHSPSLDIKEIIGVLSYHDKSAAVKSKNQSTDQLEQVFDKSQVNLELLVDKLSYNKMMGSQFKASILLANGILDVKNRSMQGAAKSSIRFNAQLIPKNELVFFKANLTMNNGQISTFLTSFDNFGVTSFKPNDIKGKLSLTTSLTGTLDANRELIKKSLGGNFKFDVKNGTLTNFEPIQNIGNIIFPNRNLNSITFSDLYGITTIKGDKISIKDFKITSNVLNMDVNGVYSLSNSGTDLGVKIPLRNPKEDYLIADDFQREAIRYNGIIVNLNVVDDKDGKTKIKLGKSTEEKQENKRNRKAERAARRAEE